MYGGQRKRYWISAVWVVCIALLGGAAFAQDDPPPQAGRLSVVYGTVSIEPAGTDQWGGAYPNYPLGPGDRIYTDQDGRAEIQIGQTYVRVAPNSDVTLVEVSPNAISFGVGQGSLHVHAQGLWQGQSLYVQTPSGSATLNQPANLRVDVMPSDQAAVFTDFYGSVYVSGAGGFGANTLQGQVLELTGTNPVYPQWLAPNYPDDFDHWSDMRDQQIARAQSYRYVSPEIPGAYDLDVNGEWMPDSDYGPIWFPRVRPGWAPYRYGHWVHHQPWGWVWVEDEPWGYAPFHYGRWVNYGGRWGWVPGPPAAHPVWSPALVVFAGGGQIGGGGMSVWFPLGPGEPYRPWYPCSPRYIDEVNISNIRPTRVVHVQNTYVNIVNVTNITNITYVNRTVGATAVRQQDFAAGRPVAQSAVHIDPQQMQRVQVIARPEVAPTQQAIITRPPARPVPVAVARPQVINPQGKLVAAQPKATPVEPPVRPVSAPRPLPGRTVVAPPAGARMQTPAPTQPQRPQYQPPAKGAPAPQRPVEPAPQPREQERPAPPAQQPRPSPTPVPQPTRPSPPPAQEPRPNTPPAQQPHPNAPPQQPRPNAPPPPQPRPNTPPAQQPRPNTPAPQQPRPTPAPETRPAPPRPENKPAPPPQQDKRQERDKDKDN